MMVAEDPALTEQLAYYSARAAEYDQWWHRQGRYDRGPEENARWFRDAGQLDRELEKFKPVGDVLELACGTGLRTNKLIQFADSVLAVDGSAEMLKVHASQVDSPMVQREQIDLFDWTPSRKFDVVYFGFWLSHVPPDCFETFWAKVGQALKPDGRFFFVDSKRAAGSAAVDHLPPAENSIVHQRRLNDGAEFRVYKIFYDPPKLQARLRRLDWDCLVGETENYFIYGHGRIANA